MTEHLPWILRQRGISSFAHDHLNHVFGAFYELEGLQKKLKNPEYTAFVTDLEAHINDLRGVHDRFVEMRRSEEEPPEIEKNLAEYVAEVRRLNEKSFQLAQRARDLKLSLEFQSKSKELEFKEGVKRLEQTPQKFDAEQLGKGTKVDLRSRDLHTFLGKYLDQKFFDREGQPVKVVYNGKKVGRVEFDAQLLERSVNNLVTDALNHSPGRPIYVNLSANDGNATISVTNKGTKLVADEIARISHERFTKAMHDPRRGYGKISVRLCTEAQGGSFRAGNSKIGPMLSLHLPLRRSAA